MGNDNSGNRRPRICVEHQPRTVIIDGQEFIDMGRQAGPDDYRKGQPANRLFYPADAFVLPSREQRRRERQEMAAFYERTKQPDSVLRTSGRYGQATKISLKRGDE